MKLPRGQTALWTTAGLYSVVEALDFRVNTLTRLAFGMGVLVVWALVLATARVRAATAAFCTLFLGLCVVYSLPFLVGPNPTVWVIGDLISAFAVVGAYLVFDSANSTGETDVFTTSSKLIPALGVIASITAFVWGATAFTGIVRFRPPPSYLIVLVATGVVMSVRGHRVSVVHLVIGLSTLAAALYSGFRTSVLQLLLPAPLILVFGLRFGRVRQRMAYLTVLAVVLAATTVGLVGIDSAASTVESLAASSRFDLISGSSGDASTQGRFVEASEALGALEQRGDFAYLFGLGNGSFYHPEVANTRDFADSAGRFHSIHLGPVRTVFRYGILTLVGYGLVFLAVVRRNLAGMIKGERLATARLVALAALSLDWFLFNPFIQFHSAVLAGWVLASLGVVDDRKLGESEREQLSAIDLDRVQTQLL